MIFASIEGIGLSVFAEDVDGDGRPEVFFEYVVGAHTHVLRVYKFPAHGGRPFPMEDGWIGADGSVICWSDEDGDGLPEIYAAQHIPYFIDEIEPAVRKRLDDNGGGFWDVYKFMNGKIVKVCERKFIDRKIRNMFAPMYGGSV